MHKTTWIIVIMICFIGVVWMAPALNAGQKEKKESLGTLLDKADKAFDEGNYKAALEYYRKALDMEPDNIVIKEKMNDTKKKLSETEKPAKFTDYINKSDNYFKKGEIKYAFLYLIEAYRSYPDGYDDVKKRLRDMQQGYAETLSAIMEEKQDDLKSIRTEIDSMLTDTQPKVKSKAKVKTDDQDTPPPAATAKKKEGAPAANEKFLAKVKAKAANLYQNEKGNWEAEFANKIVMIYIPEGEFTIGSPDNQGKNDEHPAHKVFIDGYWLAKTETTFAQFDQFCSETNRETPIDENWGRDEMPVINVSWNDACDYCTWLSQKTGLRFRLPTEAEWEKAAHDFFPWGPDNPTKTHANFNKKVNTTTPVGSYPAGEGFYGHLDLAGNVWEWCQDYYAADYYENSPIRNPKGPEKGAERVVRGGSFLDGKDTIRSASRDKEKPSSQLKLIGFRIALEGK